MMVTYDYAVGGIRVNGHADTLGDAMDRVEEHHYAARPRKLDETTESLRWALDEAARDQRRVERWVMTAERHGRVGAVERPWDRVPAKAGR